MDKSFILSALRHGTLRLEGQFMYGSNYTFMVVSQYEGQRFEAVYKPTQGERPLWDFPDQTLSRREVAAYLVSEGLGWGLVPPTVYRIKKSPMGPGSVQLFIAHNPEYHYFNLSKKDREHLPKVMAFDFIINNADRKGGHLLIDPDDKLWLIDHGLSFHVEEKIRTVVWDHAGEPIPGDCLKEVTAFLERLSPGCTLYRDLRTHLLEEEMQALKSRAKQLADSGTFPLPPEDRRAYPWPLI